MKLIDAIARMAAALDTPIAAFTETVRALKEAHVFPSARRGPNGGHDAKLDLVVIVLLATTISQIVQRRHVAETLGDHLHEAARLRLALLSGTEYTFTLRASPHYARAVTITKPAMVEIRKTLGITSDSHISKVA